MAVDCICTQCRKAFQKDRSQLNRALRASPGRLYCSLRCAGRARRVEKEPLAVRRAKKAAYDAARRLGPMREEILAEKKAYYRDNFDPEKMRLARWKRRDWMRAYGAAYRACPEWKRHKRAYDRRRRERSWGQWAHCVRMLLQLERLIRKKNPNKYERMKARGYYEFPRNAQKRKRDVQISRW